MPAFPARPVDQGRTSRRRGPSAPLAPSTVRDHRLPLTGRRPVARQRAVRGSSGRVDRRRRRQGRSTEMKRNGTFVAGAGRAAAADGPVDDAPQDAGRPTDPFAGYPHDFLRELRAAGLARPGAGPVCHRRRPRALAAAAQRYLRFMGVVGLPRQSAVLARAGPAGTGCAPTATGSPARRGNTTRRIPSRACPDAPAPRAAGHEGLGRLPRRPRPDARHLAGVAARR